MTGLFKILSRLVIINPTRKFCSPTAVFPNINAILTEIYNQDMDKLNKRTNSFERTRYNGRVKKRRWEENQKQIEGEDAKTDYTANETFERIRKRKCVILLAYYGANYFGMQRNLGMSTIEEDLLVALKKSNCISDEGFNQVQQIQFQRAARTDKGVSAAMQIVSVKLPDAVNIEEINNNLPPDIRVFSIKRVTKGFNSKSQCDARTYTYLVPTYAFEDYTKTIDNHSTYRATKEQIDLVNSVLEGYLGTKNYHNFTCRKKFLDPSSKRYMMSFHCGEPFIMEDMEYCIIKVKGQSFMMHQIRKMVGLALAIVRGNTSKDKLAQMWGPDGYDIPLAPGLGLVLDEIHYDRYNKRFGSDGIHEPLTWEEIQDKLDAFKKDFIYSKIAKQEKSEMGMASWLESLVLHTYEIRGTDLPDRATEEFEVEDDSDDEKVTKDEGKNTKKEVERENEDGENGEIEEKNELKN